MPDDDQATGPASSAAGTPETSPGASGTTNEAGGTQEGQRRRVISHPAPRVPRTQEYRGSDAATSGGVTATQTAERPDLELREVRRGSRPGTQYVRTMRAETRNFLRVGPGVLQATDEALAPHGAFGRFMTNLRRRAIGTPL